MKDKYIVEVVEDAKELEKVLNKHSNSYKFLQAVQKNKYVTYIILELHEVYETEIGEIL